MRIEFIDKLKGLAIGAVVVGHVIDKSIGMAGGIQTFCYSFHMPLFMFLSGVFAYKHVHAYDWREALAFVRKKALRVVWPFFVVGGLYVLAVWHQGGDASGAWEGYWFLPALFYNMLAGLAVYYVSHWINPRHWGLKITPHLRKTSQIN